MKKTYRSLRVAEHKGSTKGVVICLELVEWPALLHLPRQYEVFSYRIRPEEGSYKRMVLAHSKEEANAVFEKELAKNAAWKEVR